MGMGVGKWLATGKVGASSTSLAAAALGVTQWENPPSYPHDSDDFSRCLKLYGLAPSEARAGLKRLAAVSGQWDRLAENWDELIDLYATDKRACSEMINKLNNPAGLRSYQVQKGADGRWDIHPW